ncbi:hypothetical protein BH11CYA1_BH11CYA1_05790 [soil metagenome]
MVRSSDLGDSGDSPKQLQAALDSSPKFHEQLNSREMAGLKLTKVASSDTASADAASESADEASGNLIEMLRKTKPEELSPNLRAMQGLVENFATADDKAKALEQMRGGFDKAIKQSDDDLTAANDTWTKESPKVRPEYQAKTDKVAETSEKLQKVADTIPDEQKEHMQSVVHLWSMGDSNSPQLRKALEAEIGLVKGLPEAVKDSFQAIKEAQPIVEKVTGLQGAIKQAEEDRVVSRMIYAEVLAEGGDAKGAKQMQIESMAIQMNVPLEQVKELSNRPDKK